MDLSFSLLPYFFNRLLAHGQFGGMPIYQPSSARRAKNRFASLHAEAAQRSRLCFPPGRATRQGGRSHCCESLKRPSGTGPRTNDLRRIDTTIVCDKESIRSLTYVAFTACYHLTD